MNFFRFQPPHFLLVPTTPIKATWFKQPDEQATHVNEKNKSRETYDNAKNKPSFTNTYENTGYDSQTEVVNNEDENDEDDSDDTLLVDENSNDFKDGIFGNVHRNFTHFVEKQQHANSDNEFPLHVSKFPTQANRRTSLESKQTSSTSRVQMSPTERPLDAHLDLGQPNVEIRTKYVGHHIENQSNKQQRWNSEWKNPGEHHRKQTVLFYEPSKSTPNKPEISVQDSFAKERGGKLLPSNSRQTTNSKHGGRNYMSHTNSDDLSISDRYYSFGSSENNVRNLGKADSTDTLPNNQFIPVNQQSLHSLYHDHSNIDTEQKTQNVHKKSITFHSPHYPDKYSTAENSRHSTFHFTPSSFHFQTHSTVNPLPSDQNYLDTEISKRIVFNNKETTNDRHSNRHTETDNSKAYVEFTEDDAMNIARKNKQQNTIQRVSVTRLGRHPYQKKTPNPSHTSPIRQTSSAAVRQSSDTKEYVNFYNYRLPLPLEPNILHPHRSVFPEKYRLKEHENYPRVSFDRDYYYYHDTLNSKLDEPYYAEEDMYDLAVEATYQDEYENSKNLFQLHHHPRSATPVAYIKYTTRPTVQPLESKPPGISSLQSQYQYKNPFMRNFGPFPNMKIAIPQNRTVYKGKYEHPFFVTPETVKTNEDLLSQNSYPNAVYFIPSDGKTAFGHKILENTTITSTQTTTTTTPKVTPTTSKLQTTRQLLPHSDLESPSGHITAEDTQISNTTYYSRNTTTTKSHFIEHNVESRELEIDNDGRSLNDELEEYDRDVDNLQENETTGGSFLDALVSFVREASSAGQETVKEFLPPVR